METTAGTVEPEENNILRSNAQGNSAVGATTGITRHGGAPADGAAGPTAGTKGQSSNTLLITGVQGSSVADEVGERDV